MRKTLILPFILCAFLCECLYPPSVDKEYPTDIIIPGTGTLKYTWTFWDPLHSEYSKHGTKIESASLIDNTIWILVDEPGKSSILVKDIHRTASVSINKPIIGDSYLNSYRFESGILHKGKYIIFCLLGPNDMDYYIARVNRTTLDRQYIRMSKFDGKKQLEIYNDNENVFLRFEAPGSTKEAPIYTFHKINENCNNFTEITEQEFNDSFTPSPGFTIDNMGRYYRFSKDKLEVSVDEGNTWHHNDMGTNIPVSIIIQKDSIYVFCYPYEGYFDRHTGTEYTGGGIHVFKWQQ